MPSCMPADDRRDFVPAHLRQHLAMFAFWVWTILTQASWSLTVGNTGCDASFHCIPTTCILSLGRCLPAHIFGLPFFIWLILLWRLTCSFRLLERALYHIHLLHIFFLPTCGWFSLSDCVPQGHILTESSLSIICFKGCTRVLHIESHRQAQVFSLLASKSITVWCIWVSLCGGGKV